MRLENIKIGTKVVPSKKWLTNASLKSFEDIREEYRNNGYLIVDLIENIQGVNLISVKYCSLRYLCEDFDLYQE